MNPMNGRVRILFFILAAFAWLAPVQAALPSLQHSLESPAALETLTVESATWKLVDVQSCGFTDDGTPLALFVFVELPDPFDMFAPVSTRAGPETHTRVLYVVQPVLGLDVMRTGHWPLSPMETIELGGGNNPVDYLAGLMQAGVEVPFGAFHNVFGPLGAGDPSARFEVVHNRSYRGMGYAHGQYINMLADRREWAAQMHQEYLGQIFWNELQDNGEVKGLDFFRYWMLTQHNGLGFVPLVEGVEGYDLYGSDLNGWQRTGRVASGTVEVVGTALAGQQAAYMLGNLGRQTVARASNAFQHRTHQFYNFNGRLVPASRAGAVGNLGPRVTVNQQLLTGSSNLADHHIFPSQFKRFFQKFGITIDDYTVTLDHFTTHLKAVHGRGNMGQMPGGWNKIWGQWIDANSQATLKDVFQQAGKMMDDFGLSDLPIHRYKR